MQFYDDEDSEMEGGEEGQMPQGATDSKGKTALIDSSICPGMKPGDTLTVKIDKVLDSGEYSVSYPEGSDKEEEPMMEESMAPESDMESVMG